MGSVQVRRWLGRTPSDRTFGAAIVHHPHSHTPASIYPLPLAVGVPLPLQGTVRNSLRVAEGGIAKVEGPIVD